MTTKEAEEFEKLRAKMAATMGQATASVVQLGKAAEEAAEKMRCFGIEGQRAKTRIAGLNGA